ncbi:hypothetical protein DFH06DRAFT_1152553 [Mycena polygramma]|nr:hypothetical protein DFH06DRAFT_1152553 [Mycena polygramma]
MSIIQETLMNTVDNEGQADPPLVCRACPDPAIVLPDGWDTATTAENQRSVADNYLYTPFIAMDGNFSMRSATSWARLESTQYSTEYEAPSRRAIEIRTRELRQLAEDFKRDQPVSEAAHWEFIAHYREYLGIVGCTGSDTLRLGVMINDDNSPLLSNISFLNQMPDTNAPAGDVARTIQITGTRTTPFNVAQREFLRAKLVEYRLAKPTPLIMRFCHRVTQSYITTFGRMLPAEATGRDKMLHFARLETVGKESHFLCDFLPANVFPDDTGLVPPGSGQWLRVWRRLTCEFGEAGGAEV